jgi:hypothetical protein
MTNVLMPVRDPGGRCTSGGVYGIFGNSVVLARFHKVVGPWGRADLTMCFRSIAFPKML